MVVFRGTDDAQHYFWGDQDRILACYQQADTCLQEIMTDHPDAHIILVSDHGFGKAHKFLYVNNLLYNHGLLHTHTDPTKKTAILPMYLFERLSPFFFHFMIDVAGRQPATGAPCCPSTRRGSCRPGCR